MNTSLVVAPKPDIERLQVNLSENLAGFGFTEIMNNSLTSPAYTEKLGGSAIQPENNVELLNPLSQDLAVMRQTLIFQALESVAHNQNRQRPDVRFFEFGKTYQLVNGEYLETKRLTIVMSGAKQAENWTGKQEAVTYFTLKGIVKNIFERLGLSALLNEGTLSENSLLADGQSLTVLKTVVGEMGWINAKTKKHFGIKNDVFVADLNWDAILDSLKLAKTQYKELPKTFEVRRDFSLLLNNEVRFAQIAGIAQKTDKKILQRINLFDVYEGKNLPEGKKSYAVSFTFQDAEQTLKDEQVDKIMENIRAGLEKELGAELR